MRKTLCYGLVIGGLCSLSPKLLSQQATGVRVGEVSESTALVWMRVTREPQRNRNGEVRRGKPRYLAEGADVTRLEGAAPGAPGRLRLRYATRQDMRGAVATPWVKATAARDYSHAFKLQGLGPDTLYYYSAETAGKNQPLRGSFRTKPAGNAPTDVTFTVITGLMYKDVDDTVNGFKTFESMRRLQPSFIVPTGDNVYYDNEDPIANTPAIAHYHWDRIYSYPNLVRFFLEVPGYWEKDDHDTLFNDCWPSMRPKQMLPLTFEDGRKIFLEEAPVGDRTWRTVRWGRDLQIWLTEGRDFRSPNIAPDGPEKTIWGAEQKQWIKQTLLSSDAKWKVMVSPTPIIGPDRGNKGDNHANRNFQHEGDEFRSWVKQNVAGNFFVACGDRHWQYHSIHPATGMVEFACGPVSDQHAGGSPGENKEYHRFHRVKGGFLSVSVRGGAITFRLHDVDGGVVYEWSKK